jgi:glycosyltransferase involved in cell wall biosynthesis
VSTSLRIFVTADPELPVPPRLYGGIERIIDLLIAGLMERGHQVTLFANRRSTTACELVPYRGRRSRSARATLVNAATIARRVIFGRPDVVQSFGRLAYLAPVLPLRVPKVMSYQRVVTPASIRWSTRLARGSLSFTGCSHRLIEPVEHLGSWTVIHNAVPVDRYRFAPSVPADAPLVFLGRLEYIKGPHLAVEVARRAGRRLILAGTIPADPEHGRYFRKMVAPAVDGRDVTYVGPVDDAAKSDLLAGAAALLMPVLWEEPFGIVMAEALACGTPVIGLGQGAVPEVVEDGVTGFVCGDVAGMVEAVSRLDAIARDACRRAAEQRYSQAALVGAYESLYQRIVSARPAPVPSRGAAYHHRAE